MKIIAVGQDARNRLKRGIDLVADSVKITLGPSGRNVVLGRIDLPPRITNDGVSIARNIEADDEVENEGVWIMKEALSLASNKSKDATTTTATLTQAITNKLFDMVKDDGSLVSKKVDAIQLKKDVDKAYEEIVDKLREKAKPIKIDQVYDVALSAGEYEWIAKMVSEVYAEIGKDGHVTVEEGIKNEYKTFKGIELAAGYHSEYFINNDSNQCVMEKPRVLVTNNILDTSWVLPMILDLAEKKVNNIILIAPEFTPDLLKRLNTTKLKTEEFNTVAIKLPTFGKDDILKDVAALTEAKFLDKNAYSKVEDFIADIKAENLGTCESATIGESSTILQGGNGNTKERVKELKKIYKETQSMFDKDIMEKRIAYLSGGIAVIKVASESDFENGYLKGKMENAVSSAENALREGVVKGGGLALKEIGELRFNMLCEAIQAPYRQIQENNGSELIIPDNVLDPVKNTISALKTACSIAGTLVTTERVISFKKDESKDKN